MKKQQLLSELVQVGRFEAWLESKIASGNNARAAAAPSSNLTREIEKRDAECWLRGALSTFRLHVDSRRASSEGKGFYTIGPCGEELLGALGLFVEPHDSSALHYRHLATLVTKHLRHHNRTMEQIMLDRARGYVVSTSDPVTGGKHCALGGTHNDYYVTSTIASQCPAAVGRALGEVMRKSPRTVNLVTIGDGSSQNAGFLAAKNVAENMTFKNYKLPVLFCVSDNDLSISLKGQGWMSRGFQDTFRMRVFRCREAGTDPLGVYRASKEAFQYVRESQKPAALFFHDLPRRFGHAATDRQGAYLSAEEIARAEDAGVIERLSEFYVEQLGYGTYEEVRETWREMGEISRKAFERAAKEEKVKSVSSLVEDLPPFSQSSDNQHQIRWGYEAKQTIDHNSNESQSEGEQQQQQMREVTRKLMNRCLIESMERDDSILYLGEDVRHGGYYLVTENVAARFPNRILDWLPDETTLIGAGIGLSQRGFLPIVEIPYLKYLDCGYDQFAEAVILNWYNARNAEYLRGPSPSSDDSKSFVKRKGMVFRLQGFDTGVFGGNFHTHNSIPSMPGLDVFCFSNGRDWAERFPIILCEVSSTPRAVAVLDPTENLNRRRIDDDVDEDETNTWRFTYSSSSPPDPTTSYTAASDIIVYGNEDDRRLLLSPPDARKREASVVAVVAYGNGVPYALRARNRILAKRSNSNHNNNNKKQSKKDKSGSRAPLAVLVIDSPLLSEPSPSLRQAMQKLKALEASVIFADSCKLGHGNPFGNFVQLLRKRDELPHKWSVIGAEPTYNPLASTLTFLSSEKIEREVVRVVSG